MITALLLMQALLLHSEDSMLRGPLRNCEGHINPKLGTYTLILWCPADIQNFEWTFTEPEGPFYNRTIVRGCRIGCDQPVIFTRIAPRSSSNYVPDAWAADFRATNCYHAFFEQWQMVVGPSGLISPKHIKVDWCTQ